MPQRTHYVMDYETLVNLFVAVFVDYKTSEQKVFVVHFLRNDFKEFVNFLNQNIRNNEWHISYNGLAFDSQITQFILINQKRLIKLSADEIVEEIYNYAQSTINRSVMGQFSEFAPYKLKIKQIDVFKLNHWDNRAKMSGLKWIQYSMDWYNVEEMPHKHDIPVITQKELDDVINYCCNDVLSTKQIFEYSKEQILLRQTLTNQYKIDLYSASEPRISKELFLYYLEQKTKMEKAEIKTLRTPRSSIDLKDCILPYIKFQTPEFQGILDYFNNKTISSTKDKFKYSITHKEVQTDYGLGGIHGSTCPGVYEPKPGWTIMTSDVTSFYPNLAIKNGFHPEHLPKKEFSELYEWFFEERKKYAKSDPINYVYKIILNSTYGLSGDENSFLYDPKMTMDITINGQLLLSMLYEMLSLAIPEAVPLMQNTDGLEMMIPNSMIPTYMEICAKWEKMTQLLLEHDQYSKMIIRDVNNYMAVNLKGKVKCKGVFEWEDLEKKKVASLHKNKSFLIIPKAIYAYFINGVKPEDFLDKNNNIFDYCAGIKAKGDWHFETRKIISDAYEKYKFLAPSKKIKYLKENGWEQSWAEDNWVRSNAENREANNGIPTSSAFNIAVQKESVIEKTKLQKIIRYFISNTGEKLMKVNSDGREIQVDAGRWKQTVANKIDQTNEFTSYDINKKYYLDEIYKQIDQINQTVSKGPTQLQLF